MAKTKKTGGVSLAKGPVALVGLALLAYGITAFILGGHSFSLHPPSGTVNGKTWLGLEVNAWSSLLFIAAGALLLFSAPAHWSARSMSLIVGLVLGAASVIALYDKHDVFGIFAANGLTELVWGAAATVLLVLALLPRIGRRKAPGTAPQRERPEPAREDERERLGEPRPERARVSRSARSAPAGDGYVGSPSTGSPPAGSAAAPAAGPALERGATRSGREDGER